jgi:hypothetical protein
LRVWIRARNRKMLTEGRAYLPTTHWRELTPVELAVRLEANDDLLHLLQWNRGDPRLTAWEEAFLTGMVRTLQKYRGKVPPTPKQWDQIRSILAKLDTDAAETVEMEMGD